MNRSTSNRRSLTAIVQKAITSGNHRVDISPGHHLASGGPTCSG